MTDDDKSLDAIPLPPNGNLSTRLDAQRQLLPTRWRWALIHRLRVSLRRRPSANGLNSKLQAALDIRR
jgi:hypothetical protein